MPVNNTNEKVVFKIFSLFTSCITDKYNTQPDNAEEIGIVMPMYNLIEYSDAYLKTFGSLWQYYGDETSTDNNNNITDFPANNNNSNSLKLKQQIKGQKRGIVGAGGWGAFWDSLRETSQAYKDKWLIRH